MGGRVTGAKCAGRREGREIGIAATQRRSEHTDGQTDGAGKRAVEEPPVAAVEGGRCLRVGQHAVKEILARVR